MTGSILWYLHDHGRGHLDRARAVIPHLDAPVVVAAGPGIHDAARSVLDVPVVALPSDVPVQPARTTGPWHHAPSGTAVRIRSIALAAAIERHRCVTAVVDVSMEVTVLARLFGLRVVTLRQSGRRNDHAHRIGLDSADVVWVPQHRDLEPLDAPPGDHWTFTGTFSRFDQLPHRSRCDQRRQRRRLAVLMVGQGGHSLALDDWRGATAPRSWRVAIAGTGERSSAGDVTFVGHREPIFPLLEAADVVITSAGWSAVADTVAAGAHLVVIPEERPFDEQHVRARALAAAGLAISSERWPAPDELETIVTAATALDPGRWHTYHDGRGAHRAAHLIDEVHAS